MTDMATATTDAGATGGAPNGATAPVNGAGAGTSQPAAPWYAGAGYTDDDRAYLENKGWTKQDVPVAPVALKSYRELERVMGDRANAILMPKIGDEKGMTELFQKLGMPDEPTKYALPEGVDPKAVNPEKLKAYQGIAHKAKMTNEQFGTAFAMLNEAEAQEAEQAITRFNGDVARTKEKLLAEMGDQYGEHVARGNLAMRHLGLTVDDVGEVSSAIGVERATRLLMKIGGMLAQDKAIGLTNGGKAPDGFVTDKARAQSEISKVKMGSNPQFQKALMDSGHPEHKTVTAQWREWQRIANSK